ncbi:uncharacterized protein BDZ83DRAFT_125806 [Colletotrichum acutatum]|uniref:Uncharacterized protein n=1 Tax=Glomerella acutata TaxID=27357 RepID=A0AAD8UW45_GLOAC|nr:uncharacterized protein BDZ83DRAFT_125806 [Colletotrichum acutatum]KAK1728381.1 hypothetical protein BDZ83DRAFT_125806 [Colletotrichum acutatum]
MHSGVWHGLSYTTTAQFFIFFFGAGRAAALCRPSASLSPEAVHAIGGETRTARLNEPRCRYHIEQSMLVYIVR